MLEPTEKKKKRKENRFPFARPLHIQQPKAANDEYIHYADNNESVCHSRLGFFTVDDAVVVGARTTTPLHTRFPNISSFSAFFFSFSFALARIWPPSLPCSPLTRAAYEYVCACVCVCHSFVNTLVLKSPLLFCSALLCSVSFLFDFVFVRLWQCLNSLPLDVCFGSDSFRMLLWILLLDTRWAWNSRAANVATHKLQKKLEHSDAVFLYSSAEL